MEEEKEEPTEERPRAFGRRLSEEISRDRSPSSPLLTYKSRGGGRYRIRTELPVVGVVGFAALTITHS